MGKKTNGTKVRRPNGYKFFLNECIAELRNRCPGKSIVLTQVSKMCSQSWNMLDERTKERFRAEAERLGTNRRFEHIVLGEIKQEPVEDSVEMGEWPEDEEAAAPGWGTDMANFPLPPIPIKLELMDFDKAGFLPECAPPQTNSELPLVAKKQSKAKGKAGPSKPGKKKPKGGPKRPLSSFIYFCKDERIRVKEAYPDLQMGQISKVLSQMWLNSDAEIKAKYKKISNLDRERYTRELAQYKDAPEKWKPKLDLPNDDDLSYINNIQENFSSELSELCVQIKQEVLIEDEVDEETF